MTKADFERHIKMWGDCFKCDTCPKLQFEIIKKIVNCKAIDDNTKLSMIDQYTSNQSTNNGIVNAIRHYNKWSGA